MKTKFFPFSMVVLSAMLLIPATGTSQTILLSAGDYGLLGGTAISIGGPGPNSITNGHVGLWPAATSNITGFPPGTVSGTTLSGQTAEIIDTGSLTTGQAMADLMEAQTGLAGMPSDVNLSNIDLGTVAPLAPGVYTFNGAAEQTGALVLDAQGQDGVFWVFQIGTSLSTSVNSTVEIINLGPGGGGDLGVFWNAGSFISIGDNNTILGNYLAGTSISFTGSTATLGNGGSRALAQAGVSFAGPGSINPLGGIAGGDWDGGLMYDPMSGAVVPIAAAEGMDNEFTGISTRTMVSVGDFIDLANASVVIGGTDPMSVVFRARSTSIAESITAAKLPDPIIDVVKIGTGVVGTNDNWADAENLSLLDGTTLDPETVGMDANESILILENLEPGAYSVRVRSAVEGETGLVIIEALAVREEGVQQDNELLSISTRSLIGAEAFTDVSNSSIIISGQDSMTVVFRGRSTSISESITAAKLPNPIIDVVKLGTGVIGTNDNWADAENLSLLDGITLHPETVGMDANESILILENLEPGAYSVRVRSAVVGETGLAISEAIAISN